MSRSSFGRLRGRCAGFFFGCLAITGIGVSPAAGVITVFTDRTAFETAAGLLGPIQNEGFESLPVGALPVGSNQLGLINLNIGVITVTTSGASIQGAPAIGGERDLSVNADEGMRTYDLTFGGPISAVGFDFQGAATGGIATLLADGQSFPFGAASNGFFGIISTTPLASVGFGDTNPGVLPTEIFNSDNFSFVIVPEPTTAALLVPAALMLMRRRTK